MFFERKIGAVKSLFLVCLLSFLLLILSVFYFTPKVSYKQVVAFNLPDPFTNTFHDNQILRSTTNKLLVVWSPSCSFCRQNMQTMPNNSVNIVHNTPEKLLIKNKINLLNSKTLVDSSGLFAMNMGIVKLPTYIVVDPNGNEIARSQEVLTSELQQLLSM